MDERITETQALCLKQEFLKTCENRREVMIGLDDDFHAECLVADSPNSVSLHRNYHKDVIPSLELNHSQRMYSQLFLQEFLACWPSCLVSMLIDYAYDPSPSYLHVHPDLFDEIQRMSMPVSLQECFRNASVVLYPLKLLERFRTESLVRQWWSSATSIAVNSGKQNNRVLKFVEYLKSQSQYHQMVKCYIIVPD